MTDIGKIKALTEASTALKENNIAALFSYVIQLYVSERIAQTDVDADGDMLLYQWGTYRKYFELDLTRQIMPDLDDPDDCADAMMQLSVRFRFHSTKGTKAIGDGNIWCHTPSESDEFKTTLMNSAAFLLAQQAMVVDVSITLERV
ncbi:hypothetical protein [Pectobacterium sp. B1J-3]|uniref:hypothetical protein n=1 Tax=Pectobacterium sp. B1J-3 TaxID=3385371 RepID=UPI003906C50B